MFWRPIIDLSMMLEDISRPIMLEDMPWLPIKVLSISWPIILEDMSLPIRLEPWFMRSDDRYMLDDIWLLSLFPSIMLFMEVMSRPIMLLAEYMSWLSSMSEVESMTAVILVLIRSGSTAASASRLILLMMSASSRRMWNPWLSAM